MARIKNEVRETVLEKLGIVEKLAEKTTRKVEKVVRKIKSKKRK